MPFISRLCICLLACLLTSFTPHFPLNTQPYTQYSIPILSQPYASYPISSTQNTQKGDHALFFAVNTYDHLTDLEKPIQNARDIATELQHSYGFQTEIIKNPSIEEIDQTISTYRKRYADGIYPSDGQLFIFFSGHGIEAGSNGYFMAKDSDPDRPQRTAMEYDYYRDQIDQINCQHILVAIDACHSATFDPSFSFRSNRRFQRSGEQDFDRILANHESYQTRVFWTSDGVGEQTPDRSNFAYQLLEGLRTHRSSTAYLRSSVLFSNYLEKAAPKPGGGRFGGDEPSACFLFFRDAADDSVLDTDVKAWNRAKQAHTIDAYRTYLADYPQGDFVQAARQRIQQLEEEKQARIDQMAWSQAKAQNTQEAYQFYLDTYPNGQFRDAAEAAIFASQPAATPRTSAGQPTESTSTVDPNKTMEEFLEDFGIDKDPIESRQPSFSSQDHSPYKTVNFGGGSGVSKQVLHSLADASSRARLITSGTRVKVLQQITVDGQAWTHIEHKGRKGWIKSTYLK